VNYPPRSLPGFGRIPRMPEGSVIRPPVSPKLAIVFIGAALCLLPWTYYLMRSLPNETTAAHWRWAWVGFDVMLAWTAVGTAIRILMRSPKLVIVATVTGTLLIVDAWFDVLTAASGTERAVAICLAVFAEIPAAIFCLRIAFLVEGIFEQARPHLLEQGFKVEGKRLIPPDLDRRAPDA
jgi:hypothetical protein